MSTVKRKTWNPHEYFRQLLIIAGTLTECLLELPEKFCSRTRWPASLPQKQCAGRTWRAHARLLEI